MVIDGELKVSLFLSLTPKFAPQLSRHLLPSAPVTGWLLGEHYPACLPNDRGAGQAGRRHPPGP